MKRRLQARRRFQRKRMGYLKQMGAYHPKRLLGIHSNAKGFSRAGSKKKPKQPMETQRQMTREAMRRAGLHQTKAQRRRFEEEMTRALGYKPAKLSDLQGVGKPSRYTVKRRVLVFDQRGKSIGEKLIFKRLAKRGQGKGGGGGERGSRVTGSAAAKKSVARLAERLGGKRGMKPGREKKKKKK